MRGLRAKQLRVVAKQMAEQTGNPEKAIYKLLKNKYVQHRAEWVK